MDVDHGRVPWTRTTKRADMKTSQITTADVPFLSKIAINLQGTDLNILYKNALDKILESLATFQMRGSNLRFVAVVKLDPNTVILRGSSYIELQIFYQRRKR